MIILTKKIFLALTLNTLIFITLIIGIQNSTNKSKVNLLFNETIELPVSFIIGLSLISGSFLGILLPFNILKNKD